MTLAILSALPQEQHGLLALMEAPHRLSRGGRDFWRGRLLGQDVVLALSRVGKVAAATTATTLIEHLGAGRMLFTGVAGGVGPEVRVGDIVVAEGFVQHDLDASPLFPRYQVPLYDKTCFDCDVALSALLRDAAQETLQQAPGSEFLQLNQITTTPQVHHGLIATGDQFVNSAQEALALRSSLRNAGWAPLAVEMEGAAVAQVCHDYGVPFAAARTISDRADDQAHVDFGRFIEEVASRYALATVTGLLRRL
jgi:adenosylhomocysteine nucleosidase